PVFALPYSRARQALDELDASTARKFERDMKVAQQLRKQAAKLNNIGINSGSDLLTVKTKQLGERAEKLEDAAVQAHRERSAGAIRLANRGTHAKVLITPEDAAVETPDGGQLFRTGKRHICQTASCCSAATASANRFSSMWSAPPSPSPGPCRTSRRRHRPCSATATRRCQASAATTRRWRWSR